MLHDLVIGTGMLILGRLRIPNLSLVEVELYQLSRRRLVFTEKQAYFQCRRDIMAEDVVCETRSSLFNLDKEDRDHRVQSMSMGTGLGQWQWPFTLADYAIAVLLYTARHLSFPDDVLVAFLNI